MITRIANAWRRLWYRRPRRDIGTLVFTGIAEDIPMPIIRSGDALVIEDVDDSPLD